MVMSVSRQSQCGAFCDDEFVEMVVKGQPMQLQLSPDWAEALPVGPDTKVRITEAYADLVARDAYFWAWPMINLYSRRQTYKQLTEPIMLGPVPAAPLNRIGMLTDYIAPEERIVACPNQDVVYGAGTLALDLSPVIIQVPDFGDRFWVYQIVDLRTDSFVHLGKMYATTPGFYLLVGPDWIGDIPKGITRVFRSSTNTGFVIPRVFQDDTAEDKRAVQAVLRQIIMYPLADYDGTAKSMDWSKIKNFLRRLAVLEKPSGSLRKHSSISFQQCSLMHHRDRAKSRAMRKCTRFLQPLRRAHRSGKLRRRQLKKRKLSS
jgi:hypothetical protein